MLRNDARARKRPRGPDDNDGDDDGDDGNDDDDGDDDNDDDDDAGARRGSNFAGPSEFWNHSALDRQISNQNKKSASRP